ncbi:hypothetical protein ACFLQG_01505 [Candidatus Zixiibacteriota bacterium]
MRKHRIILFTILVLLICGVNTAPVIADVPQVINYQGRLTDTSGDPLNSTVQISFTIFDGGGASKWTEIHSSVVVSDGLFNVLLGTTNPIPDSIFNHPDRYLGMKVGGDGELTPRTKLTSVPYAMRSSQADTAEYAAEALISVIIERNDTSLTTGAIWPDAGRFSIQFDSTFTRPPIVNATFTLRSDGGGYDGGSTLFADFTVTTDGFTGFIYTVRGGSAMSAVSMDITYTALQIGP